MDFHRLSIFSTIILFYTVRRPRRKCLNRVWFNCACIPTPWTQLHLPAATWTEGPTARRWWAVWSAAARWRQSQGLRFLSFLTPYPGYPSRRIVTTHLKDNEPLQRPSTSNIFADRSSIAAPATIRTVAFLPPYGTAFSRQFHCERLLASKPSLLYLRGNNVLFYLTLPKSALKMLLSLTTTYSFFPTN